MGFPLFFFFQFFFLKKHFLENPSTFDYLNYKFAFIDLFKALSSNYLNNLFLKKS